MKFEYYAGPQRVQEWYDLRMGKVTASRLKDWLAVGKQKAKLGKPLAKRLDYEKELVFEKQFGVAFDFYVTEAMQDGIDLETFAKRQYEKIKGTIIHEVGGWYSDTFMASPDGGIFPVGSNDADIANVEGIVEVKVLRNNKFVEVLEKGVPDDFAKQIQGQLFASKAKYCDFIAINTATKKVKIIRVLPNQEEFDYLELALEEKFTVPVFSEDDLFDFIDELPEGADSWSGGEENNSSITRGW